MKVAAFYENILEGAGAAGISVKEAVRRLMDEGLDLLYISGFKLNEDRELVEEIMTETGIGVEGLYMFYDFGHHPEDRSFEALIDNCKALGGTNVLIVPGMLPQDDPDYEARLASIVAGMKAAVAYGQTKDIAVSMEDFDGLQAPFHTADQLDYFMQAVPGLMCSFDTGNFIMYHEDELAAFERFKDRICTVHLKDRENHRRYEDERSKFCADGAEIFAAVTGDGTIRMKEILNRLKAMGYQGNGIIELYDYSPGHMLEGIAASVRWVKAQCQN